MISTLLSDNGSIECNLIEQRLFGGWHKRDKKNMADKNLDDNHTLFTRSWRPAVLPSISFIKTSMSRIRIPTAISLSKLFHSNSEQQIIYIHIQILHGSLWQSNIIWFENVFFNQIYWKVMKVNICGASYSGTKQ